MELSKIESADAVTVVLEGRMDTASAENIQHEIENIVAGRAIKLIIDLAKCTYVSSAGLRVFINLLRDISGFGGAMVLINVPDNVMAVLDMTGFSNILTIE